MALKKKTVGTIIGSALLAALTFLGVKNGPKILPKPTTHLTVIVTQGQHAVPNLTARLRVDDGTVVPCQVTDTTVKCDATGPRPYGGTLLLDSPRQKVERRVYLSAGNQPRTCTASEIANLQPDQQHDVCEQIVITLRAARSGLVRLDGPAWVDDDGLFYPFGATYFYAYDALITNEARFRATCEWLANHHVQFIRVLGQVAWPQTANPPFENGHAIFIRPFDDQYPDTLGRLIDIAYDDYGLRVELSIYGEWPQSTDPSGSTPVRTAERIRDVVASRLHKMHSIETTNEGHVDQATMFAMGDVLKSLGILLSPTTPNDIDQGLAWVRSGHGFTHVTPRFERGNGDKDWRFPRQPSEWKADLIFDNNEPQGPASSLAATPDINHPQFDAVVRLTMARAISISRGGWSYVLHNAAGVNGFKDDSRGRTAELWEMPNIAEIMEAVGRVHELIPDLRGWSRTSQSRTNPTGGQVLTSDAIWSDGADHGVSRNYGNNSPDGRFIQFPIGVLNYANFVANEACHVTAYNPVTRSIVAEADLQAGQIWRLEGDPETNTAYILVGERR